MDLFSSRWVALSSFIGLAIFLAISPLVLLGDGGDLIEITSDDLSEKQLISLQNLDLARNEAGTRLGQTTITNAILIDEDLLIAGTWEAGALGFENQKNAGGRDGFIAKMDANGSIVIMGVFGSPGEDSLIDFEINEEKFIVRGYLHGDGNFSEENLPARGIKTVYEAHLQDNDWTGAWHIDEELIQGDVGRIWCGF